MEMAQECVHCGDVVEDEFVVVDEAFINRPRKIAHIDCDRIAQLRPIRATLAID